MIRARFNLHQQWYQELLEGFWLGRNGWGVGLKLHCLTGVYSRALKERIPCLLDSSLPYFLFLFIRSARLDGVGGPVQLLAGYRQIPDDGVGSQPCTRRYPKG